MEKEFTHFLPSRDGVSRELYLLELRAAIEHSEWVLCNPDLFSEAMMRYHCEELDLLEGHKAKPHFRRKEI